jgi:IS1 family transposase
LKTAKALKKKLSDSSVNYGSIATDDWDSFVTAFKGENHLAGKKYTVGIEGDNCRLRHRILRAFRKTCCFSKKLFNYLNAFNLAFFTSISVLSKLAYFGERHQRFIHFVIGNRSKETAKNFREKIRHHKVKYIVSYYWKSYENIAPRKKRLQTKAETFTVEGYNSLFRHFFARMTRKSKCYSKKMEMLKMSILLLMHHRNGTLSILN